jgi:hypothetical protein
MLLRANHLHYNCSSMGRPMYVCATCSQHFTRRYSANRHNSSIHIGRAEIVPYIDYMAGRNSGQYLASHPSRYRSNPRHTPSNPNYQRYLGSKTVADTGGSLRTDYFVQGPSLPNASTYSSTPTFRQREFQESNPKIEELRALLAQYASPHEAAKILEWVKIGLKQGDEKFLNQELQQFRELAKSQGWKPF